MKRFLCLLLCACLLAVAFCCPVSAQTEELSLREQVIGQAKSSYSRSRVTAEKESFNGFCGLMTSHQLYNLKINTYCISNDGNMQFDYYKDLEVTTGGYYPTAYGADQYTLEEALNAVSRDGMKDVFNILVGFQWSNTEAGSQYGHAVLINAILDGMCYFVESFDLSLNTYHPEGSVIVCSIADFAGYFAQWTAFEGIIHFGTGVYSDACDTVETDVTVQVRFESQLRSQPCLVGQNDCVRIRSVAAGEQLRATGILTDKLGQRYYRIEEGGVQTYIAAGAVCAQQVNLKDLVLEDPAAPRRYRGGPHMVSGTVIAKSGSISAVEVRVTDSAGVPALRERAEVQGSRVDVACLNESLYFDLLDPGSYTVEIYADSAMPVVVGGQIQMHYSRVRLWRQTMQTGTDIPSVAVKISGKGNAP